jgi:hypothetical protein
MPAYLCAIIASTMTAAMAKMAMTSNILDCLVIG